MAHSLVRGVETVRRRGGRDGGRLASQWRDRGAEDRIGVGRPIRAPMGGAGDVHREQGVHTYCLGNLIRKFQRNRTESTNTPPFLAPTALSKWFPPRTIQYSMPAARLATGKVVTIARRQERRRIRAGRRTTLWTTSCGRRCSPAFCFGGVAEWFKAPDLKSDVGATSPGVRIPPPPPACRTTEGIATASSVGSKEDAGGQREAMKPGRQPA